MVKQGGDTWFFLTADHAFGHALERDTSDVVKASGGKVLGSVKVPLGTSDFSSFLLQAQSSKAKIVGLANAGSDTINSIKRRPSSASSRADRKWPACWWFLSDIHGLGLTAQGLQVTTTFYWDLNDATRAWSKRFAAAHNGRMPTMVQAGVYAGLQHYLRAVDALQADSDGAKMVAKMKELPRTTHCSARAASASMAARSTQPTWSRSRSQRIQVRLRLLGAADHSRRQGVPPAERGQLPAGG